MTYAHFALDSAANGGLGLALADLPATAFPTDEEVVAFIEYHRELDDGTLLADLGGGNYENCPCSRVGVARLSSMYFGAYQAEMQYCKTYVEDQAAVTAISALASFVAVIANALLKNGLTAMAHFSRYVTRSKRESSLVTGVFFAQWFNTAVGALRGGGCVVVDLKVRFQIRLSEVA